MTDDNRSDKIERAKTLIDELEELELSPEDLEKVWGGRVTEQGHGTKLPKLEIPKDKL